MTMNSSKSISVLYCQEVDKKKKIVFFFKCVILLRFSRGQRPEYISGNILNIPKLIKYFLCHYYF